MNTCFNKQPDSAFTARKIVLTGQVQGVGFRPYIYRLAVEHELHGWVRNCVGTVEIHVQGQSQKLENFVSDIFDKKPSLANPELESDEQTETGKFERFNILPSQQQGEAHITVPTDLFLCDDCLTELYDPADRRYRYPFINCTQCGPRYTLIKSLPYDRTNTTMAGFELCPACLAEYKNPLDRRFHAEPVACPACGPSLTFHADNLLVNDNQQAINKTVDMILDGKVIAVKGIGGYHLMCDATNTEAVARLRKNKPRPDKPLAVMFPAPFDSPFDVTEEFVSLTEEDKAFLLLPSRAILLVDKNKDSALSDLIAPHLNEIGMMLPYSPLHHLLLNDLGRPLVATSANISGEPVLTDNLDVEKRLAHVADACLHHDRLIQRPADDPVYRTIAGKPRPIRTGRGCAPMELVLPFKLDKPVLAVGAHMKNTITLAWKNHAVLSPHIGEMDSARSLAVFENTVSDLQELYGVTAEQIICDAHPGYSTTRWANKQGLPVLHLFHHHAHASSAYYECHTDKDVIVFAWDGVGYGDDGTLWGGETFLGKPGQWQRVASMREFYLPGADKTGREPWRSAAALCWQAGLEYENIPEKDPLLKRAWQKKMNAPQSTAVGRLFDAAAALTGVCSSASFEGQGAMILEALCGKPDENFNDWIELTLEANSNLLVTDWQPLIPVMQDSYLSLKKRALLFHHSLAHCIWQQAKTLREQHGVNTVSFCGGVFQNRVLTEKTMALLSNDGFDVYLPELMPVNDAGISFGQVMEYGYTNKR